MRQTILAFKLEESEQDTQLTGYAGVPLIHEAFRKFRLPKLIKKHVKVKEAGWNEVELIETMVGQIVAGGDHLEDVRMLESDLAYVRLLEREKSVKQRINDEGAFPSAKAEERFLKRFHTGEKKPEGVDAWVPKESKALQGLGKVNQSLCLELIKRSGLRVVTIEDDATAVFSHKEQACGTYKGGTGFMPRLCSIAELGIIIGDEFRDGNVPPGFEVKRVFQACLKAIPKGVKKIRTRLDGAYYDHDFIKYLKDKDIEFTITAKKSPSLIQWIEAIPEKEWKALRRLDAKGEWVATGKQWAELDWSSADGTREKMRERMLRIVVTRKTQKQWELFQEKSIETAQDKDRYEAIATNMSWMGQRLIHWHYEKAGGIEHLHDRLKNELAGGVLPCAEFGANAAWWRIQCITWNLIRALQLHALPQELTHCHLKKLRFRLFCIAGKVIRHAREVILKLSRGHPSFKIYQQARFKLATLGASP